MLRTGERIKPHQLAAFALALTVTGVIAAHNGEGATLLGVALVLVAAMGLGLRQPGQPRGGSGEHARSAWCGRRCSVQPLLLALSLLLEGPAAILAGIGAATPVTWAAVIWQSVGNTMFGYACWAWLLSRYPAATVAPMSLLVFGFRRRSGDTG
ncbi:MAG: DMT family transporter [Alphaproteobacteria bacterium]